MNELEVLFENMNSFAPSSDFLFTPMNNDFAAAAALRGLKLGVHDACRSGLFKTNTEMVTRKKNAKEAEFERRSSQCHIQERESSRYKLTNVQRKTDIDCKTVERDDIVSQRKEISETKILLIERRPAANKYAVLWWKKLKRLVGLKTGGTAAVRSAPKIDDVAAEDAKMIGFVIGNPSSFDEVDPEAKESRRTSGGSRGRALLSKIVSRKRRAEPTPNAKQNNGIEPKVSETPNQVQSGRILEVTEVEGNDKSVFQIPKLELDANDETRSNADPMSAKNFFVLKFNLAKKKPATQLKE